MPRRSRTAAATSTIPDSSYASYDSTHLLGYVEEEETVDMIMKKFEALEQVKQGKEELNEDDLKEVFKQTSLFTVESAAQEEVPLMDEERIVIDYEEDEFGNFFFFDEDADEDDDEAWGEIERRERKRAKRSNNEPKQPRKPRAPREKTVMIRLPVGTKRVIRKIAVPGAVPYTRIPNEPVPSSWARRILPFVPEEARLNVHTLWKAEDVNMPMPVMWKTEPAPLSSAKPLANIIGQSSELNALARLCGGFHGVVLNPPWKEPRPGTILDAGLVPEDLLKLPLGSKEFLPAGFVYVWTPKHLLLRTLVTLEKMDLHYVENAIVVWRSVANGPLVQLPCSYFAQSKDTLLLCRRGERAAGAKNITWERVEMRHQRTSDVHEACLLPDGNEAQFKPYSYVHKLVETMLPEARSNLGKDTQPRLLELWGRPLAKRSGWVNVFEQQQ